MDFWVLKLAKIQGNICLPTFPIYLKYKLCVYQAFFESFFFFFLSLVSCIFYNLLQKGIQPNILYIHT